MGHGILKVHRRARLRRRAQRRLRSGLLRRRARASAVAFVHKRGRHPARRKPRHLRIAKVQRRRLKLDYRAKKNYYGQYVEHKVRRIRALRQRAQLQLQRRSLLSQRRLAILLHYRQRVQKAERARSTATLAMKRRRLFYSRTMVAPTAATIASPLGRKLPKSPARWPGV